LPEKIYEWDGMSVWASKFGRIRFGITADRPALLPPAHKAGGAPAGGLELDKHLLVLRHVAGVILAPAGKEEIESRLDALQNG
jgi:hypothetical protein